MAEPRRRLASLLSGAAIVAVATGVANVLGYLLTIVAARTLPPQEFGAFAALLSVIIVGNVAALAAQAVVARAVATGTPWDARSGLVWGLTLGSLGVLASPLVAGALRLGSPVPAVAVSVAVAALAAAAGPIGVAQGRERTGTLAFLIVAQGAFRVSGGIAGLLATGSLEGSIGGLAAGLVVSALLAWAVVRPRPAARRALRGRDVAAAAAVLLGFVALSNADVVVARAVLEPAASGAYGAGAVITKVAFWLPQFVPLIAYARLSRREHRERALRLSLLTVAASGAGVVLVSTVGAEQVLWLVGGPRYLELAPVLWWFALLGAVLALAQVTVYSALARRDRTTTVLVWLALVALVGATASATTVVQVVSRAVLVAVVLVLVTGARELRRPGDGEPGAAEAPGGPG